MQVHPLHPLATPMAQHVTVQAQGHLSLMPSKFLVRSKCMPIVLYGLECFSVAKADIKSLDFAVTRFLMKLFRTTNIDVIEECRLFFNFLFPSEMPELRRTKFECKLMNCSNVLNYFGLGLTALNVQLLCYMYSLVKLVFLLYATGFCVSSE